jgi:hypothetical protein
MDDKDSLMPEYSAKWWMKEIKTVEDYFRRMWWGDAEVAIERYLDIRGKGVSADSGSDDTRKRKYNIFWANVQIIKSALYATPPKPAIKRQHDDAKDDVARTAALILERIINFELDKDQSDMHAAFDAATEGLLLPGLGQAWLRYESFIGKKKVLGPNGQPVEVEVLEDERVSTDTVNWRDFLYSISRTWDEVWWVGRRIWKKKKAFVARFGEEKYKKIKDQAESVSPDKNGFLEKGFLQGRVEVFEIWCEATNKIYWVNRHLEECLDEKDDFAKLDKFWPCPKPLLATHTANYLYPVPDYRMVLDQYEELDTLNDRISILTRALRVVGVFDGTQAELKQMLSGGEFNMIPVQDWAQYAEKGGMKNIVDWFPVDVIAKVLTELSEQRIAVINQIYELTSISDIMRGASNPRDTLGAQKLKAQYSSVRLQLRQQDVGKFVRGCIQLKCELICKHWSPETIKRVSQIEMTNSAELADEAIELLKNYRETQYRIEVGEETLSLADYNAERELRVEYITAVGQFMSQAGQILEAYPMALPYILKMVAWVTSAFRGSSDIETVLDEAITQATANPPQKGDDGAGAEAQAKVTIAQMQMQKDAMEAEQKAAMEAAKIQSDERIALEKIQSTERIALENNRTTVLVKQMELGVEDKKLAQAAMKMELEFTDNEADRQAAAAEGEADREVQMEQTAAQLADSHESREHAAEEGERDRELAAKTAAQSKKEN